MTNRTANRITAPAIAPIAMPALAPVDKVLPLLLRLPIEGFGEFVEDAVSVVIDGIEPSARKLLGSYL
jgi:hypothetical protein